MPENCDGKTLSYTVARHPAHNIYDMYYICNMYICNNDICYILIIYSNNIQYILI